MMAEPQLTDAIGVALRPGQRVIYATAGMHSTGELVPGTIVNLRNNPHGDGRVERIAIRRDDGHVVYIRWSKRVLVLRQDSDAEAWLRRQLATLGAR
jgi:hypothetical protein